MPTRPADHVADPAGPRRHLYPASLAVTGRPCLVVGGGPVAAQKVATLVECGAEVTVVAPDVVPDIDQLPADTVTVLRRPYRPGEAAGYRLVVTATGDPEVDGAVADDAERAGIWVNAADDPDHCTFMLPSVHRDGPVTVAVSTGGASPALASWLRRRVADAVGPAVGALAELLAAARRDLQHQGVETSAVDWHALLDGPLPALVADGRTVEARRLVGAAAQAAVHESREGAGRA